MDNSGVCYINLEEQKGMMKMGLTMVIVGHINFLLGALVHGVVLRHISLHVWGQTMESTISNIIALAAGLMGIVIGILMILLSKNRKNRILTWSVFVLSATAGLVAAASVVGLTVSLIKTAMHGDKSLLAYCGYTDDMSHISITNECPFDPTRIYSTTIMLWIPLIIINGVQMVFSCRLFKVSISYLALPCCLDKQHQQDPSRLIKTRRVAEPPLLHRYAPTSRRCQGDGEQKLPVRPPEGLKPPCESRPHLSAYSSQLDRGALERSSIWI